MTNFQFAGGEVFERRKNFDPGSCFVLSYSAFERVRFLVFLKYTIAFIMVVTEHSVRIYPVSNSKSNPAIVALYLGKLLAINCNWRQISLRH